MAFVGQLDDGLPLFLGVDGQVGPMAGERIRTRILYLLQDVADQASTTTVYTGLGPATPNRAWLIRRIDWVAWGQMVTPGVPSYMRMEIGAAGEPSLPPSRFDPLILLARHTWLFGATGHADFAGSHSFDEGVVWVEPTMRLNFDSEGTGDQNEAVARIHYQEIEIDPLEFTELQR